jgi:hypothetical protein
MNDSQACHQQGSRISFWGKQDKLFAGDYSLAGVLSRFFRFRT